MRRRGGRFTCVRPGAVGRALAGAALPVVALAGALSACGPNVGANPLGLPKEPNYVTGVGGPAHPVTDLNLAQLVPPGGIAVTPTPIHGLSPSSPPDLALGRFTHLGGTFNAVFTCLDDAPGKPAKVGNTWYNSFGPLWCDLGPDTESLAVCHITGAGGQRYCRGRTWYTFTVPNTAKAVMPRFKVPATGVSWTLFAWIAPRTTTATSGVTAATGRPSRFAGYGLSFSYPRRWYSLVPKQQFDNTTPGTLLFESTALPRDSCPVSVSRYGGASGGFPCGRAPVSVLSPGGVLVSWATNDVGTAELTRALGTNETVAGRPARVFSGPARPSRSSIAPLLSIEDADQPAGRYAGPSCRQIGASWIVEATVSLGPGSVDQMIACIRAPRTATSVTEVLTMLRSLHFAR